MWIGDTEILGWIGLSQCLGLSNCMILEVIAGQNIWMLFIFMKYEVAANDIDTFVSEACLRSCAIKEQNVFNHDI